MNTNFHATKDRPRGVNTDRCHMGGEQYRREMRAALHELRQRLGEDHKGASGARVVVTAGPAPSTICQMRGQLFPSLRSIYTFFTSYGLV
jgi:hypothetical protein